MCVSVGAALAMTRGAGRRRAILTVVDLAQSLLQSPPVQFTPLLVVQLPPQLLDAGVALVLRLFHVHLHLGQDVRDLHVGVSGRGMGCQAQDSRVLGQGCLHRIARARGGLGIWRLSQASRSAVVVVVVMIRYGTDGDGGKLLFPAPPAKSRPVGPPWTTGPVCT